MISLPENHEQLARFSDRMSSQEINFKVWSGVRLQSFEHAQTDKRVKRYIQQGIMKTPTEVRKVGNVGLALAHLSLWEHLQKEMPDAGIALVFEDDEIIGDDFLPELERVLDAIPRPFDFLNINALRAKGNPVSQYPGLYQMDLLECMVKHQPCRDKNLDNVWLSAYILTKEGVGNLLEQMKQMQPDMSKIVFDHAVSFAAQSSSHIKAFAMEQNTISQHKETDSFRRAYNNDRWKPSSAAIASK